MGVAILTGTGGLVSTEVPDLRHSGGSEADNFRRHLLALGGASWPKLGSDAAWVPVLEAEGVEITPLRPANCGFDCDFSESFDTRFSGQPIKSVKATSAAGTTQGEFVISKAALKAADLCPFGSASRCARPGQPCSAHAGSHSGADGGETSRGPRASGSQGELFDAIEEGSQSRRREDALLREVNPDANQLDPGGLARLIKALPLPVKRPRPIAEAISTAGGVALDGIDDGFMLKKTAWHFRVRRNARLGSANRRLSAHRLLCDGHCRCQRH